MYKSLCFFQESGTYCGVIWCGGAGFKTFPKQSKTTKYMGK